VQLRWAFFFHFAFELTPILARILLSSTSQTPFSFFKAQCPLNTQFYDIISENTASAETFRKFECARGFTACLSLWRSRWARIAYRSRLRREQSASIFLSEISFSAQLQNFTILIVTLTLLSFQDYL